MTRFTVTIDTELDEPELVARLRELVKIKDVDILDEEELDEEEA